MMRKHCCEPYFGYLARGEKTVEGRLNRGDWKEVTVGMKIEFFCEDMSIVCEVVAIHHVQSFAELYERFGRQLLPNGDVEVYRRLFTEEEVVQYGVLGLEVLTL